MRGAGSTAYGATKARRRLAVGAAALAAAGMVAATAGTAGAAGGSVGSPGIGDPYYPDYGNGGYDVAHYAISVSDAGAVGGWLTGTTHITATATQRLTQFDLDLVLKASSVLVNGRPAQFSQPTGHELVVQPQTALRAGDSMDVEVAYAGNPATQSSHGISPWITTDDGWLALGEPEIAAWWFPSNDHPRDKATYDISVTVPHGLEAISNGRLMSTTKTPVGDTWTWRETTPMASYLAYAAVGQFDITTGTANGLPWLNAIASNGGSEGAYAAADLARTPEVIAFHSKNFGPYPHEALGGVAPAASFGFALENQTRPTYSRLFWTGGPNIYVVVHELAHQWYGDSVSVHNWRDIWLNEGFATFATWLWSEGHGEGTGEQLLKGYYQGIPADSPFWSVTIGNPGAHNEFNGAVYTRGAMTLQALRNRIGEATFSTLLKRWAADHRYRNGSILEFIALAEQLSGQQLGTFFDHWLSTGARPAATAANGLKPGWDKASATREAPVTSRAKIDAVVKMESAMRSHG